MLKNVFAIIDKNDFYRVKHCLVNGPIGGIKREGISLEYFSSVLESTFYLLAYLCSSISG